MADPKHLPDVDLDRFASEVSRGSYRVWTDQEAIPEELRTWTVHVDPDAFRGASLYAASSSG